METARVVYSMSGGGPETDAKMAAVHRELGELVAATGQHDQARAEFGESVVVFFPFAVSVVVSFWREEEPNLHYYCASRSYGH